MPLLFILYWRVGTKSYPLKCECSLKSLLKKPEKWNRFQMFIWTLRVNLCRVQLHYGTVFLFFHWLLPSCARHWDKNRPIIQFNTDPVLSGQLRYCSRTELSNVCACAETGEVWGRSNDRLRKDFLNNVTFWRFKVANDDVADMCSTLFSPAIFKIYSS